MCALEALLKDGQDSFESFFQQKKACILALRSTAHATLADKAKKVANTLKYITLNEELSSIC